MTDLQHFRKQKNHETSNTAFGRKREAAVLDSIDPKCPFTMNTSTRLKQALTQRVKSVLQQIELLKEKDVWLAREKPDWLQLPRWVRPLRRVQRPRRSRAGFTLGETLFVLLIVITVLVGVISLYNGARNNLRNAALQSQMMRAVGIIERAHSYSGTYGTATLLGFLNNEGFSANEVYKDGSKYVFKTPYGTDITIVGAGRDFTMVVADLPPAACKIAALVFRDSGSGLDVLTIEGGSPIPLSPLNESAVDTACNDGDEGTSTVSLTF